MKEKDCFSFETIVTNVSALYCMTLEELLTTKMATAITLKSIECLVKSEDSNADLVWLYQDVLAFMPHLNVALKEQFLRDVEAEIEWFQGEPLFMQEQAYTDFEDEFGMLYCLDIMPISEMVEIPTYEELFPEDVD